MTAPPCPGEKSRNRSSWARMAATFASSVSRSSRFRSDERPDGSPIMPGPAADHRDRAPAEALQAEQPEDRHQVADVERVGGRVEPDVAGDRAPGRQPGRPGRASSPARMPRQSSSASRPHGPSRPPPRASPSQGRASSRLDQAGGGCPFVHAPYAIVRPQMQTSSRAAPAPSSGARASAAGTGRIDRRSDRRRRPRRPSPHHRRSSLAAGVVVRRGRLQPLRRGPPRPGRRHSTTSSSSSRRSSTTGPARSSWPGSATSSASSSTFDQLPG